MLVACSIIVDEKSDALLIPLNSLVYRNNQPYVFVIDPVTGVVEKRLVSTGFENTQFIEVLAGIDEQEFVVTEGRHRLVDGGQAEIVNGRGGL
jgi:multidrug efflux pump subunit AcrA (membrane-fusion protein)